MSRLENVTELNNAVQIGNAADLGNAKSLNESLLRSLIGKYGVPGLIFNNSPSTVFTDSIGTDPANVGDVVGRVNDLSGGDHHLEQSTTAAKPILRDGPLLEFDGVDDILVHSSQPFTGGELTVIWCGRFRTTPTGTHFIFAITDSISNIQSFSFYASGSVQRATVNNNGSLDTVNGAAVDTTKKVFSCRMNGNLSEVSQNQVRTTKTLSETLNLSTYELFGFGASPRPAGGSYSPMDQEYAFVINKCLTDTELANAEQYIANLRGVTL